MESLTSMIMLQCPQLRLLFQIIYKLQIDIVAYFSEFCACNSPQYPVFAASWCTPPFPGDVAQAPLCVCSLSINKGSNSKNSRAVYGKLGSVFAAYFVSRFTTSYPVKMNK